MLSMANQAQLLAFRIVSLCFFMKRKIVILSENVVGLIAYQIEHDFTLPLSLRNHDQRLLQLLFKKRLI